MGISLSHKIFLQLLAEAGLPEPEKEIKFDKKRLYRFDYGYTGRKLAIEIEGGIYGRKAHGSITGILRDINKYNLALLNGWRVYRVPTDKMLKEKTIKDITKLYNQKRE